MAAGDWAPGSKARLTMVSIMFDPATPGHVIHCGVGYQVVAPSGAVVAERGHTWGGPGNAPPEPHRSGLQGLIGHLVQDLLQVEGLDSVTS